MSRRGSAARQAQASYNRAALRTAAVMTDPKASLMDRYRAAAAEESAAKAAAGTPSPPDRKS